MPHAANLPIADWVRLLAKRLSATGTLDQAATVVRRSAEERYGADAVLYAVCAAVAIAVVALLIAVAGFVRMMRTPPEIIARAKRLEAEREAKRRKHEKQQEAQQKAQQRKKGKGSKGDASDSDSTPAASPPPPAAVAAPTKGHAHSGRTQAATLSAHSATLRGFKMIGVLAASPCGTYAVATCREKRKAVVYPQFRKFVPSSKAKDENRNVVLLEDVPSTAVILRVAFTRTGKRFALFDVYHDCAYVFNYTTVHDEHLHSGPHERSGQATLYTKWVAPKGFDLRAYHSLHIGDDGATILASKASNGLFEAFDVKGKEHPAQGRFKVSKAGKWSTGMATVATMSLRGSPNVMHMLLAQDGLHYSEHCTLPLSHHDKPERFFLTPCGTRALVRCAATGAVRLYALDVELHNGQPPKLVCEFCDPDFTEIDHMAAAHIPRGGSSGKTDLFVALARGGDVVAYGMPGCGPGEAVQPKRMCLVHDAHDGLPVDHLAIVGSGAGLATAAEEDASIRLWSFV